MLAVRSGRRFIVSLFSLSLDGELKNGVSENKMLNNLSKQKRPLGARLIQLKMNIKISDCRIYSQTKRVKIYSLAFSRCWI